MPEPIQMPLPGQPGGQEAPELQPQPEPELQPEPEPVRIKVRNFERQVRSPLLEDLGQDLRMSREDLVKAIQIGIDGGNIYTEQRQREAQLARWEAQLQSQREELERSKPTTNGAVAEPDFSDGEKAVRYLASGIDEIRKELRENIQVIQRREEVRNELEEWREAEAAFSRLNDWANDNQRPAVDREYLFGEMERLGLGNSNLSWDEMCSVAYRNLTFEEVASPAPQRQPPSRSSARTDPRAPVIVTGGNESGPQSQAPRGPKPGETIEQRIERLQDQIGRTTRWHDLPPP